MLIIIESCDNLNSKYLLVKEFLHMCENSHFFSLWNFILQVQFTVKSSAKNCCYLPFITCFYLRTYFFYCFCSILNTCQTQALSLGCDWLYWNLLLDGQLLTLSKILLCNNSNAAFWECFASREQIFHQKQI